MRFDFKPIRKKIELADYAAEMSPGAIEVRVNVDRETINRMRNVSAETTDEEFFALLQELWNDDAAPEGSWPVEDIQALWEYSRENDLQFWPWLVRTTFALVFEYQAGIKKA